MITRCYRQQYLDGVHSFFLDSHHKKNMEIKR